MTTGGITTTITTITTMKDIERLAYSFELPVIDDLGDPFPGEREKVVRSILEALRETVIQTGDASVDEQWRHSVEYHLQPLIDHLLDD